MIGYTGYVVSQVQADPGPGEGSGEVLVSTGGGAVDSCIWVAAERLPEFRAVYPDAIIEPEIRVPERMARREWGGDEAAVEIVRGRLEGVGPTTVAEVAASMSIEERQINKALLALEAEGFVFRGLFTAAGSVADEAASAQPVEWCERRLLQRIHRYTVNRMRAEIEPVSATDYMRFLLRWQHVAPESRLSGGRADVLAVVEQLQGFEVGAGVWECG